MPYKDITDTERDLQALWPSWYNPPRKKIFDYVSRASDALGIGVWELRAPNRHRAISRARWAVAHVMRDSLGRSYSEIGRDLHRDHSTIIHGVRESRKLVTIDQAHADMVDALVMVS